MNRLKLLFSPKIIVLLVLIFIKFFNFFHTSPFFDNFDSPEYFKFNLYPTFRLQGITFFYSVLQSNSNIVIFQILVSSFSWFYFWYTFNMTIKHSSSKIIFLLLFLSLSLSSVVSEHDFSILSESLSTSALIILITSFIRYYFLKKDFSSFIILILSIIYFTSTKSSNSLIYPILLIFILIENINLKRIIKSRRFWLTNFLLLIPFIFFINSLTSDVTKTLTTSGTINNRLWFNENWRNQLEKSGYPMNSHQIWLDHSKGNLGVPPDQAVVNLKEFKIWWSNNGKNYLLNFTLNNPDYAIFAPFTLPLYSNELNYRKSIFSGWSQGTDLSTEFEGFKNTIFFRTLFWPDEPEFAYLLLGVILIFTSVCLSLFLKVNRKKLFFNFIIIFTIFAWSYPNWWFGSKPADMARHNLLAAISWRILFMLNLVWISDILFNKLLKRKK